MTHNIKWDDLQIILAVAEVGSANRAAANLGLNHTTVIRRLDAFEKTHAITLFDRQPTGMRPTPACEALLRAARPIDTAVLEIRRNLLGQDLKLAGTVRLTTTDSIADHLLVDPLRSFRAHHPEIVIELIVTNTRLDILRLDADLSVRPSRNPPNELIGRNIGVMSFAAYSNPALADAVAEPFAPEATWIGIHHDLANSPVYAWLSEIELRNTISVRANSFVAARELAAAGLGIAVLPCFLGDRDKRLVRRTHPLPEIDTSIWVLTPRKPGRSARVRALSDHLVQTLKRRRKMLCGDLMEK